MNVVGIDLSLTSTGLCSIECGEIVELHNIKTKGKKSDTLDDRQRRLYAIANQVVDFVKRVGADLVVIEAPSYGSVGGAAHDRSGLWWIIVNALRADGFPVTMVSPQGRAKYGTGSGRSKKDVVEAFVREVYQDLCPRRIANDDEADAVLLSSMGSRHLGYPVEPFEPAEANLAAMDGVLWPAV